MQFIQSQPRYIGGQSRQQTYFSTLEDQVSADNAVRLIDAFIDKLDLQQLGFQKTIHHSEGRPPYAPQVLLKLYLYGYLNKIRSSRKLERESIRNIELQFRFAGVFIAGISWGSMRPRCIKVLKQFYFHSRLLYFFVMKRSKMPGNPGFIK